MLWLIQRQLHSKTAEVRHKAAAQLAEAPTAGAFGALCSALKNQDPEVRRLAASGLGKIEDERSVEPLLAALRDNSPDVRKAAISALRRSTDERVRPALEPLIRHSDAGVRGHAAQALEHMGWRPSSPEDEPWLLVAKGQCSKATAYGASAIPALEAVLNSAPFGLRVAAVQALGDIRDPRVTRLLLGAAKSEDPAVCVAAVDALAHTGDSQVIAPLTGLLRSAHPQVRLAALEALGNLGAKVATEPLRTLLRDASWDVRRAAAEALGRIRDPESIPQLAEALADSDADVREATAMALGNLADPRAIGPLVLTLKDPASGVRRLAAAALSRIDPVWSASAEAFPALEQLKSALDDIEPGARHFVEQLLVGTGSLKQDERARAPAATPPDASPEKRSKLAVSLFLAVLCDVDRDLRQAAAEALGRLGDPRAESALVRAVGDADPGVRAAAERALQARRQ